MTLRLPRSLHAWPGAEFTTTLKQELEALDINQLPLQQGLQQSNHVAANKPTVMILSVAETPLRLNARVGICYTGIIAGCNCADDPNPPNDIAEYCEIVITIDKLDAATTIHLADETTDIT